jgi:hypothetical protein
MTVAEFLEGKGYFRYPDGRTGFRGREIFSLPLEKPRRRGEEILCPVIGKQVEKSELP